MLLSTSQSIISVKQQSINSLQLVQGRAFFGMLFHNCFGNARLIVLISSAIIEDIKQMHEPGPPLLGYYYFDFRDALKRDVRGLLTSILMQLCDASDHCSHILSRLYTEYKSGSEHPSDATLTQCLKNMLDLPGQVPVYLIVDALDECPNNTGTPSAREKVLDFVEDLVQSRHSNLSICITSRPEQDINSILDPLTSPSTRVSLHEEDGHKITLNPFAWRPLC